MANLADFLFTSNSDFANSGDAWILDFNVTVDALAGDDTIIGIDPSPDALDSINYGIYSYGTINTGNGNDTITGIGDLRGIENYGPINTGNGNDTITGTSKGIGIYNDSGDAINTGNGNDAIIGTSTSFFGEAITNNGTIDTGDGSDTITGTGEGSAIYNDRSGVINTGNGNDIITSSAGSDSVGMANYGMINTGNGDDTITGIANGGNGVGIGNNGSFTGGTIDTGAGNDTITGSGGRHGIINYSTINTGSGNDTITGTSSFLGIVNFGTINTGTGDDTVNALQGGFGGIGGIRTGVIDLGADNDTLIGFVSENFYSKSGDFYGGVGNDKILLGDGVYSFNGVDTIISNSVGMKVYEFESIGGVSGSTFSFADFAAANQLTVSGGVATLS